MARLWWLLGVPVQSMVTSRCEATSTKKTLAKPSVAGDKETGIDLLPEGLADRNGAVLRPTPRQHGAAPHHGDSADCHSCKPAPDLPTAALILASFPGRRLSLAHEEYVQGTLF